jgi:hypothetical protein
MNKWFSQYQVHQSMSNDSVIDDNKKKQLIHNELRLLSVGESFTQSDDEDSNEEIEETFQEEESATNFVINLGNKSVILKNC